MPDTQKYVVITVEDAQRIAEAISRAGAALDEEVGPAAALARELSPIARIGQRLRGETGAAMQEIVDLLKKSDHCAACHIEGQAARCFGPPLIQKAGRRLRRLLERARGERG